MEINHASLILTGDFKFLVSILVTYIISLWSLANTDVLTDPFCIKVTNKADIWALGIVLYQWSYNEKHPYESLPGGKISRIKGGLISELFFFGSNLQKRFQINILSTIHLKRKCLVIGTFFWRFEPKFLRLSHI